MKIWHLLIFLCTSFALTAQSDLWKVSHVVDGDTFYAVQNGEKVKFRLIGIDTPEFSHFGKPEEPYAQEATDYIASFIKDKTVRLEYDITSLDRYGRHLVYVYLLDGTFVNAELVNAGWAVTMTIPPNVRHADDFIAWQREAREQGRGIWSQL